MASLTIRPSHVEAWQNVPDDVAALIVSGINRHARHTDSSDVTAHAVLAAAALIDLDRATDPEHVRATIGAALIAGRREVLTAMLRSGDALDTHGAIDPTDPDLADVIESALRASAGKQGRLSIGHHGPADAIAAWSPADVMAARIAAMPADRATAVRAWLKAEDKGTAGKRVKVTEADGTFLTRRPTLTHPDADPDPLGEAHPRHGSVYAPSTHTDAPTELPRVTITAPDGTVSTRDMTDRERSIVIKVDEHAAAEQADGSTAPSTDLLDPTTHTPMVTAFNGEQTYDRSHLTGRSRKPITSPRAKRSDNGPTTTDTRALGMTGTR